MLSQKRINELIKDNSSVFKALEEFERNGKTVIKTRMNFTIDRDVSRNFKEHCKQRGINMSNAVESGIKKICGGG